MLPLDGSMQDFVSVCAATLQSSIPSAVADFASTYIYLCSKICIVLIFMFVLSVKKKKNIQNVLIYDIVGRFV